MVSNSVVKGSGVVMRILSLFLAACLVLVGCGLSGSGSREVVFEADEGSTIPSSFITADGESVWWLVDAPESDGPSSLVRADAVSGEVLWTTVVGYGYRSRPVFDGDRFWQGIDSVEEVDDDPEMGFLVEIDAESGEVLRSVESEFQTEAVIDGVLWGSAPGDSDAISLFDVDSLDLVGEIDFREPTGPDGGRPNTAEVIFELDGVVWVSDDHYMVAYDRESFELVDIFVLPGYSFGNFEVHDGLIWAVSGVFDAVSFDPATGDIKEFERSESPLYSVEHDGFLFEKISNGDLVQVDIDSGDTVATFEDIIGFDFVVTDGYLWWEKSDTKIMRVETAGRAAG